MRIDLAPDRPRVYVALKDGGVATLSPLQPEDREFVRAGIEELSVETRYARFGQGLAHLTERELDHLANVDQRGHVAWGAVVDGQTAGIGRYILLGDGVAEVAVTVSDQFRGRGVGRALFAALAAVARQDGLDAFVFQTLADNHVVRRLVGGLVVTMAETDGTLEGRIDLGGLPLSPDDVDHVAVMDQVRSAG